MDNDFVSYKQLQIPADHDGKGRWPFAMVNKITNAMELLYC